MKIPKLISCLCIISCLNYANSARGTILVDTSPGTGAPPGTLGGYAMAGFPADPTPEGTLISSLAPPAGAPVTGNLNFNIEVEHFKVHSLWDTWSHGYGGDVYYTDGSDLLMGLPSGTLAFYLYVQPNLKYEFEFQANSGVTTTMLTIDGDAGAHFVGFYSDNPLDALTSVYVRQTTDDSDGFAVGEFGINASAVPEPSSWLTPLAALLFLGGVSFAQNNRQKTPQAHR